MLALALGALWVGLGPAQVLTTVDPPVIPEAPIRWRAPPSCPDATSVSERASQLLGRPLQPGEVELDGTVELADGEYTLLLRTTSAGDLQTQHLRSEHCEVLADTAALIAAVLVDPLAAVTTVEQAAAGETTALPPPRVAAESPPVAPETIEETRERPSPRTPAGRNTPSPRARRVHGWGRLGAGGEFGAVPGGTGGVEVAFGLGVEGLRGEVLGSYWIGREVRRGDGRATVSLGYATPRFCGLVPAGPLRIPLCAGVELGAMRADASGVPAAQTRRGFWLAGHLTAGIRWSFRPRLSLWLEAQLFVPAVFPRFELVAADGSLRAEVYQPNPAGPRGVLGLEYKLF